MLLKGKTFFLIEDDPINLAVIRVVLVNQGANVPYENWGDLALEKIVNYPHKIDMILLDINLPGKADGFGVFDAIRAEPKLAHIPIIVVTASDSDSIIPKAQAKGLNGFISKPIDRHQFPHLLLRALAGEEVWEPYG